MWGGFGLSRVSQMAHQQGGYAMKRGVRAQGTFQNYLILQEHKTKGEKCWEIKLDKSNRNGFGSILSNTQSSFHFTLSVMSNPDGLWAQKGRKGQGFKQDHPGHNVKHNQRAQKVPIGSYCTSSGGRSVGCWARQGYLEWGAGSTKGNMLGNSCQDPAHLDALQCSLLLIHTGRSPFSSVGDGNRMLGAGLHTVWL